MRTERVAAPRRQRPGGRVRVTSDRDVPPFARAGMDGYAVIAEDTFGASRFEPKTLRVVEKIYTGESRSAVPPARRPRSPPARRCRRAPTRW